LLQIMDHGGFWSSDAPTEFFKVQFEPTWVSAKLHSVMPEVPSDLASFFSPVYSEYEVPEVWAVVGQFE